MTNQVTLHKNVTGQEGVKPWVTLLLSVAASLLSIAKEESILIVCKPIKVVFSGVINHQCGVMTENNRVQKGIFF